MVTKTELDHIVDKAIQTAHHAFNYGDFNKAETLIMQLKRMGQSNNEMEHILALALYRQGRNTEAKALLDDLIKLEKDKWQIWNSLGVVYSTLDEVDNWAAIKYLNQAVEMTEFKNAIPLSNLSLEFQRNNQLGAAKRLMKKALSNSKEEDKLMLWYNMGNIELDCLHPKTAAACFDKCLKINPEFNAAHWNKAFVSLLSEEFKNGWESYESRWQQFNHCSKVRNQYDLDQNWEGQSLKGKSILLYSEQGAGDAIQFIRFARNLKDDGAYVIVQLETDLLRGDLKRLFQQIEFVDHVVDADEDVDYDFHQSICSLPFLLSLNDKKSLGSEPYIVPNTDFAPELESHYWDGDKFKVGIAWAGSPTHHNDTKRSLPVKHFQCFTEIKDVQVYSLQKDKRKRHWPRHGKVDLSEGLENMSIIDLSDLMVDYNATSNIISKMDLILAVDTSVVHLAGAMGKRVFAVLPPVPDWRWGLTDSYSYWYSSVRLLRNGITTDVVKAVETMAKKAKEGILV